MKTIIKSALLVIGIAAIAGYATYSFFSDTETSTGNNFTAGAIDLKIDSQCTYNGVASDQCGTWDPVDLSNQKFFNFADLKPGDQGENTISLDLSSNPAHACVIVENMHDNDLSLTEPESEAGDQTVGANNGEIAQQLHFFTWADTNGDNKWDSGEQIYFSNVEGPASDVLNGKAYQLPDLQPGTSHIGVYWCYGDLTVDQNNHSFTCNGALVDNKSQTDQLTANIRFYVEQARNNNNFQCPQPTKTDMDTLNLENKNGQWNVITDGTYGTMIYSNGDHRFHGSVSAQGLVPNAKYQITLNGPGSSCGFTDTSLGNFGNNAFQSGFWNGVGPGLVTNCSSNWEGLYNMNLIGDEYTVKTDASGNFIYSFDLALPAGNYTGVKVLVKKTLDTFVSPWTDPLTVHTTNLFETSPISFTLN